MSTQSCFGNLRRHAAMKGKFLCFRPITIETEHESDFVNCFGDRAFAFNNISSSKDSMVSVVPSQVLNGESVKCSKRPVHRSSGNSSSRRRKSEVKRSLSAVIKAVLFEISMSKKAQRKRKAPTLMLDSGTSESKSNSSSSLPSSSSSTNSCSSSHSVPALAPEKPNKKLAPKTQSSLLEQRKQSKNATIEVKTENRVTSCSSSRSGLLLIVIVLSVTIFYGRILAILLTSLCLYSLYPQRWLPENVARSPPVTESLAGDCRKRVIMEGLLERNNQLRRGA